MYVIIIAVLIYIKLTLVYNGRLQRKEKKMRLTFPLMYFHCWMCLAIVQMFCGFKRIAEESWSDASVKWHYSVHKIHIIAYILSHILCHIMEKLVVIQFPFSMDLDEILLYVSMKAVPSFQSWFTHWYYQRKISIL